MIKKMKINEDAKIMTITVDLIDAGYKGEVEAIVGASTIAIIKPGTSMADAIQSLKLTLAEMELLGKNDK